MRVLTDCPLAIDIFCGLGGWTEGLLEEGYRVVGFDIERHVYGDARYPAQLVLQDVLTLHGRQFKDAALIVASPPCQAYSYRAMPWKRAKALPPPDNALFEACFRIQREACEAAGRHIPLVVENVCGAQKWVGRAAWHYGSFYLWGDVPALMPIVRRGPAKRPGHDWNRFKETGEVSPHWRLDGADSQKGRREDGTDRGRSSTDAEGCALRSTEATVARSSESVTRDSRTNRQVSEFASAVPGEQRAEIMESMKATKNSGGSWFNVAHNTTSGHGQNPDGQKTSAHPNIRDGHDHTKHLTNPDEHGRKVSGDWFGSYADMKANGTISPGRLHGKGSTARKAASAHIAKIPLPLARWIARAWHPHDNAQETA